MCRDDWRTCKQMEADIIRGYLFECWIREYQEQAQAQEDLDEEERARDRAYEQARDIADRSR